MEALGINVGYLIIQILSFVILMLALTGWLYNPILNVLEERKARIAKGLEDARQAAIARDNADAEAKKILDNARSEAARLRSDASVQAEEQAAGIVAKANADAKEVVAAANAEALEERNRVLAEMRDQVTAIALAAASRIVGEELDPKRHAKLVDDFLTEAPAGLSQLRGDRAEVTSAMPLTDAQQAALKSKINAGTVGFRVDPDILGGLIVRVGDQVIDNSVAGRMGAMREALA